MVISYLTGLLGPGDPLEVFQPQETPWRHSGHRPFLGILVPENLLRVFLEEKSFDRFSMAIGYLTGLLRPGDHLEVFNGQKTFYWSSEARRYLKVLLGPEVKYLFLERGDFFRVIRPSEFFTGVEDLLQIL